MKKKPLQPEIPELGWKVDPTTSLQANLTTIYTKLQEAGGNQEADRTFEEAQSLVQHTNSPEGNEYVQKLEQMQDEDVLAQNISLWVENPEISEVANQLPEAAVEIETKYLFFKDATRVEIYRRNLHSNT